VPAFLYMFIVLKCERSSIGRAQQHKAFTVHAKYEESASADDDTNQLMEDMLQFNMCALLWANGSKINPLLLVSSVISGTLVTDVHSCG